MNVCLGQAVVVTASSVGQAIKQGVTPTVLARFLVLGMPGGVMMAADAASFDVTTVMASVLGAPTAALADSTFLN